jgi:hypothetical protein
MKKLRIGCTVEDDKVNIIIFIKEFILYNKLKIIKVLTDDLFA